MLVSRLAEGKKKWYALGLLTAFGIPCYLGMMLSPDIQFYSTPYGTTFSGEQTVRVIHSVYILCIIIICVVSMLYWSRTVSTRREHLVIYALEISGFVILLGAVFDVVLPLLGRPAFPGSCFGVFIAYTTAQILCRQYNALHISQHTMLQHIYRCVQLPIVVFNREQQVEVFNDSCCGYLGLERGNYEPIKITDLFEISSKDAFSIFAEVFRAGQPKSYRLISKKKRAMCRADFTAVTDHYGDIFSVVCIVNDLGAEAKAIEQLEQTRLTLERQLTEKTQQLERSTLQAVTTVANVVDARDEYTRGHSVRVSRYAEALVRSLGWSEEDVLNLKYIALLHDIGKIGIPEALLNKQGDLTPADQKLIHSHTLIGGELLKGMDLVTDLSAGARYHHERYDGTGYPLGLRGEDIPLAARIISLADAYDSMSTVHMGRSPLSADQIRQELARNRGTQFDPTLTDAFIRLLDAGGLKTERLPQDYPDAFADESNRLLQRVMGDLEKQTRREAENDYLTGLLNRRVGEHRVRDFLQKSSGYMMLIDLDNLKVVNDLFGHLAGDEALQTVASVLKEHNHSAISARIGGDEFLYFMAGVSSQAEARSIAEGICFTFRSRIEEKEQLHVTSISMGLAFCEQGSDFETGFANADKALYYVKQNGKGNFRFFKDTPGIENTSSEMDLDRLVDALQRQGEYHGAYHMEYREFSHVYSFVYNLAQRNRQPLALVMLNLHPVAEKAFTLEEQEKAMEQLAAAVHNTLRRTDICTRYSSVQYLIVLTNTGRANIQTVVKRVFDRFYRLCSHDFAVVDCAVADLRLSFSAPDDKNGSAENSVHE